MGKNIVRIIAFILLVSLLAGSLCIGASALSVDDGAEAEVAAAAGSRSVIGVIGGAVTIMKCLEYLPKVVKTVGAVIETSKETGNVKAIFNAAINAFTGEKVTEPEGGSNASQKQYEALASEIKILSNKLNELDKGLDEINNSIQDLNNTIIAEANKEYINDFRKEYINYAKAMVKEYNELLVALKNNGDNIEASKIDYDDLYIAAVDMNDMLYEYMTGSYRDDGKPIYEVMYEYVDISSGVSQDLINQRCKGFVEELYATYALSQYCLVLCGLYQLDHCEYKNETSYVVKSDEDSIPSETVISNLISMEDEYNTIVAGIAGYITKCGHDTMDMLYIPASTEEYYSIKSSQINGILYAGDKYYFNSAFPEEYNYLFVNGELEFVSSNAEIATVEEDGEIKLLQESGTFSLQIKYCDKAVASYTFSIGKKVVSGGYGTDTAPYLVSTGEELIYALNMRGKHTKLIANINLQGATYNNSIINREVFAGTLDGNGYTISNAVIQETAGAGSTGFFTEITGSAIVKNLSLRSITVKRTNNSSSRYIGVLAGINYGRIYNCWVDNSKVESNNVRISGPSYYQCYIGGMAGSNSGNIRNSMVSYFSHVEYNFEVQGIYGRNIVYAIGGFVGISNGSLANNLVKEPYIQDRKIFKDYADLNHPYYDFTLSYGLTAGNRDASVTEILRYGGRIDSQPKTHIINLSGNTHISSVNGIRRFEAFPNLVTNINPDELANYRVLNQNGNYTIDRDVYSELVLQKEPNNMQVLYGNNLDLTGIILLMKYESGMMCNVPVSAMSEFDPYTLGEQTVTLSYKTGDNRQIDIDVVFEVVCEHEWVLDSVIEEPTHTEAGSGKFICSICSSEESLEIDKTNDHAYTEVIDITDEAHTVACKCGETKTEAHEWDEGTVTVDPTHATNGEIEFSCVVCSKKKTDAVPPLSDHIFGEWETEVPVSCMNDGLDIRKCIDSLCEYKETKLIPKLPHTPGAPATCNDPQICTVCNTVLSISVLHDYVTSAVAPTCTSRGYTVHICSLCGNTYYDNYVDAYGHVSGGDATCDTAEKCTVCDAVLVGALGHSYTESITPPTCTLQGYTTYSCTHCEFTYIDDYVAPNGHTPGEDATCEFAGLCIVCNATLEGALGHSYTESVTPPTCTLQGYTTYSCTRCKFNYIDNYVAPDGHVSGIGPTCELAQICTVCDAVLIGALGHSFSDVVTPPTCTEQGYTTHSCEKCGSSYADNYVPPMHVRGAPASCESNGLCIMCGTVLEIALGHDYSMSKTDPTCFECGYTTYSCSRCDSVYDDDYVDPTHTPGDEATCVFAQKCTVCNTVLDEALGHIYADTVTLPSCFSQGYTTHKCDRCQSSYIDSYEPPAHTPIGSVSCESMQICAVCNAILSGALGHDYTETVTPPTCSEQGYTTYSCNRCESSFAVNYVAPKGHTPSGEATCEKAQICTVCNETVGEPRGHNFELDNVASSCLRGGYTMYTCTVCSYSYNDSFTEISDHSASNWIVDTKPQVGAVGSEHTECTACKETLETRDIAALEEEKEPLKAWEVALISLGGTSSAAGLFGGGSWLFKRKFKLRRK